MTPPTANPNTEHWPLERFKTDERTYKGVKPQLQLRQIFIAKAADEPVGEQPTGSDGAGRVEHPRVLERDFLPLLVPAADTAVPGAHLGLEQQR